MYKFTLKFCIKILAIFYISILFLLPLEWHKFAPYAEIFPAFDLIIIYYLSTHIKLRYWHIFIAGLFVDQLYNFPIGTNSFIFIIAHKGLDYLTNRFLLRDYYTNLIVFSIYSMVIILLRYLVVTIKNIHHIEGFSILFYYLTTVFSYPIICFIIKKPMILLGVYAR